MGRKPPLHFQYYYNKHNHLTYCVDTELDQFYTCQPGVTEWYYQGRNAKRSMQQRMDEGIFTPKDKPDSVEHPRAEDWDY